MGGYEAVCCPQAPVSERTALRRGVSRSLSLLSSPRSKGMGLLVEVLQACGVLREVRKTWRVVGWKAGGRTHLFELRHGPASLQGRDRSPEQGASQRSGKCPLCGGGDVQSELWNTPCV